MITAFSLAAAAVAAYFERRRGLAVGLSVLAAALLVGGMAALVSVAPNLDQRPGVDFNQHMVAAARWLHGGSFYQPWQLVGPYEVPQGEFRIDRLPVLYPPFSLVLFVPFALSPSLWPLWWAIPLTITGATVAHYRPAPWTWPVLTLCGLAGDTLWLTVSGNPVLWTTAAVAMGTRFGWPAVGCLIKPTLAPFALIGIRRPSWWVALFALALIALSFGPLWVDYVSVLLNQRGASALYPLNNVPMMLIPIVAWLGRRLAPA